MNSGMLQDILTPLLKLNTHSYARWDFLEECISVSWFGQTLLVQPTRRMLSLDNEGQLRSLLVTIACEQIPMSDSEKFLSASYYFWDPKHKKYCLAIVRGEEPRYHQCAPGALPALEELPFILTPSLEDYTTKFTGTIVGFASTRFLPGAVLSLPQEDIEKAISPQFRSLRGLHGLLLPQAFYLGTEDSIHRYYDTDITASAIIVPDGTINDILEDQRGKHD